MTMHKTILMSLVGLSLTLGACDKGDAGSKDTKAAAKGKDGKDAKSKDAKGKDAKVADAKIAKADGGADADADADADKFDDRVVKAAGLANKIDAEPSRAEEILTEAGMDRDSFYALLYEVSTPDLAEQYRLARARGAS